MVLCQRDFWRDLRLHAVACDESRKAMSTRPSFSTAGDTFSQNYVPVNVLLIFFYLYFQRRPKETAARPDSNIHKDSGFTPSPVGSEQHPLCETYSSRETPFPEKTLP